MDMNSAFRMPKMPKFRAPKLPNVPLKLPNVPIHHFGGIHFKNKHHSHYTPQPNSLKPSPQFSPPFPNVISSDSTQSPTDSQVNLILDWIEKVGFTIDVFLRMQSTYPDESLEQLNLIKNVYPPLRVLLEAQYAHDFTTGIEN